MSRFIGCVACIMALALSLACLIETSDERPGLWLSGEVAAHLVLVWSFASDVKEIFIETAIPYFIPHSVTIWRATLGNPFYVGAWKADSKHWVANAAQPERAPRDRRRDRRARTRAGNGRRDGRPTRSRVRAQIRVRGRSGSRPSASTANWRVVERD